MRGKIALTALLALPPAWAAEEPVKLKLKASGEYFLMERAGTAQLPTMVVKRIGPSGTTYSRRAFDCAAKTAMLLGSGDSLETMAKDQPEASQTPLRKDSVTEQLWRIACAKP